MLLGAHMSVSGGLSLAFERAQSIGTNTMQVFTKNQNRWEQKPAAPEEIERWFAAQQATGIGPVVSHAAYLLNLGTPDDALWEKSVNALIDELTRAEQFGILGVVLHPGAHMNSGEEAGIARIVAGLNKAHAATPGFKTLTLLETTAGRARRWATSSSSSRGCWTGRTRRSGSDSAWTRVTSSWPATTSARRRPTPQPWPISTSCWGWIA